MTPELFVCERCAVWRPRAEVTFDRDGALLHASECHPLRLIDAIKAHDTHPFLVAHLIEDVFDDDARPKSLG